MVGLLGTREYLEPYTEPYGHWVPAVGREGYSTPVPAGYTADAAGREDTADIAGPVELLADTESPTTPPSPPAPAKLP